MKSFFVLLCILFSDVVTNSKVSGNLGTCSANRNDNSVNPDRYNDSTNNSLNVVKTGRVMLGATDPKDSAPGTIRGDFCIQVGRNGVHGSDSVESANKEIKLWFKPEELADWKRDTEKWIYEF
ncbi:nucleoside diphosphate kinase, putative [Pediculus humanus corporis]|uniref:Nucleoside diphosphate kinase n=1 Tax=Pediculus humanus subsp. corporis TaxID=121224 RepID=E0VL28_PEDHC|nr:nucleoside diphosphate kinase, putative [Pediculus humanus corporis]EEB14084.1 nucleoside diphosphate kinase, putative [Pediculus humanus corporis]